MTAKNANRINWLSPLAAARVVALEMVSDGDRAAGDAECVEGIECVEATDGSDGSEARAPPLIGFPQE
jgi:hypothetical protein